jgi:hypothetical protein
MLVSGLNGSMYEQSRIGNLFYVATQAVTTWSVYFTDIYTGLAIVNPPGNNKDFVLRACGLKLATPAATPSDTGLGVGYSATAPTSAGTPLVVGTDMATLNLGSANGTNAKCYSTCTFTAGLERNVLPLGGAFTAATLGSDTPSYIDLKGAIILQPGGYAFLWSRIALTGLAFFWWSESPR